ncbi:MAG TPA: acyltransferase family protein [Sideroxyarcus sp.]|nr:acyltransferase family protein [Sideroxyarcus sp.]
MNAFSETVDRAKGLAILLVLLGHIASPLGDVIYSFHVPLFFFLAGLFIKTSHSDKSYLTKGAERLILPFLIFGTLGFLATLIKNIALHRPIEPLMESLAGLLYWVDPMHMHHYGLVLWFLPALFWGRTVVFMLAKHIRLHPLLFVILTLIVASLVHYTELPLGLDKGLVALPWICLGYLFYIYRERWLSANWYWVVCLALLCCLLVYTGGVRPLDLGTKNLGNPLFSFPYTVSLILIIFWLLHRGGALPFFSGNRLMGVMSQFGRDSLLVLVLHIYTNNMADILVNRALGSGYWYATFALSASLVYTAILLKRRYATSLIFKYL